MKQNMYIRRITICNQVAIPKEYLTEIAPNAFRPCFKVTCNPSRKSILLEVME